MVKHLKKYKLSKEAKAVLAAGKALWKQFYAADLPRKIREQYHLGSSKESADVGWYQIRNALKEASPPADFSAFEEAYTKLAAKLALLVYQYGFLKE